jgi:hypothetical protein
MWMELAQGGVQRLALIFAAFNFRVLMQEKSYLLPCYKAHLK